MQKKVIQIQYNTKKNGIEEQKRKIKIKRKEKKNRENNNKEKKHGLRF